MKTKMEQLAELKAQANEFQTRIKSGESLSPEEVEAIKGITGSITALKAEIEAADELTDTLSGLFKADDEAAPTGTESDAPAKSLGAHFVKFARSAGMDKLVKGRDFAAPEFKANTDVQAVGSSYRDLVTDIDRNFVLPYQRKLTIASLMSSATVSGNSIEYFTMGGIEGTPATVAEGALKPQVHYAAPTPTTETLREIAAWITLTDDMLEDLDFVAQLINDDLVCRLQLVEEDQLLAGDGTGTNINGLLNRSGIQSITATSATFADKLAEAKFAIEKATEGAHRADAIIMHPDDYLSLLLTKDGNNQYYGGGFFQNAYGNGSYAGNPSVWLLPTVTTTAIAKGTALVGDFKSAKVLRKGGIQVASTNSHADLFAKDQQAVRLRERVGLMVQYPAAFAKVTIGE